MYKKNVISCWSAMLVVASLLRPVRRAVSCNGKPTRSTLVDDIITTRGGWSLMARTAFVGLLFHYYFGLLTARSLSMVTFIQWPCKGKRNILSLTELSYGTQPVSPQMYAVAARTPVSCTLGAYCAPVFTSLLICGPVRAFTVPPAAEWKR